ncbi:MAG TPA: hypothetical protein VKE22_10490 [Haliangiales bacterium]|nr:hypothetical protein [Haliangiales bacterium]
MALVCTECRGAATRLRRGRCNACYMRLYRNGEIADGASCAACGERRKDLLTSVRVQDTVILCGNCSLVLHRARPVPGTVDELRRRVARERRGGPERRTSFRGGRRAGDRAPAVPSFDPTVD